MKTLEITNRSASARLLNGQSIILAAAITLSGFSAMAASKNGLNSFDFGNSYAGAKGSYSITAENRSGYSKTALNANGTVKFLAKSVKGVDFTATVENSNGRKSANYSLQVAGYTVDSGTKSVSYTWNKGVNQTFVSCSMPIAVGPVPVTISGSCGGGASISYTLQLNPSGVGLSGAAAGWATGSASAGVGVPVLNVALRSDLQLGRTSLNPLVTITPSAMSGQANLVFEPVKIDLGVVLQSGNKVWYRQDLASYSAPSRSVSLIRF
jgi:hypothetical protein